MLPGIVQSVNGGDVTVFHMEHKDVEGYKGGSHCSIKHCNVQVISKERFDMMMDIGLEKLRELWRDESTTDEDWGITTERYWRENFHDENNKNQVKQSKIKHNESNESGSGPKGEE